MAIQPEPSEGPKLVARGKTVDLGGSEVTIRFDMEAFEYIEDRWGSLNAYASELQKGHQGKMFKCVADGIRATVRDMPVDPVKLMDPGRIIEYAQAIGAAFMEAMPNVEEGQPAQEATPLAGAASSTSASPASGWRPPPSGG